MCCFVTATARTRPTICLSPPAITQIGKHLRLGMNMFLELISWLINNPNRKTFIQCGIWTCFSNDDEDDGMMLKLMLPQYHSTVSPKKYDIFRTGRSFASSGKSFFPIPARKKRYYVPLKALLGQNEGKYNILGILTEGCTHFRKYWITGIINVYKWPLRWVGDCLFCWHMAVFKFQNNLQFFLNILIAVFFYRYLFIL